MLSAIAADIGMDKSKVSTYLSSNDGLEGVQELINFSRQQGIYGVPSFSLEGQFILSGGQATEVFLSAIDRLASKLDAAKAAT